MKYITLGCSRGGKHTSSSNNVSKPRSTTKTEYKTKINARLDNGEWCLTSVELNHNHGLNPLVSRYFRCHRNIDSLAKWKLELNDRAGIRMNKNYYSFVVEAGGFENLQFIEKDCRNFIDNARNLRLRKGGGVALLEYFERMCDMNHDIYSIMDLDEEESRLRNVFWADAHSRASYLYFGDVVTFDTTYLTNRWNAICSFCRCKSSWSIHTSRRSANSSEDTHTFVWLFRALLKCMDGQALVAIITDQDHAMKSAIAIVFPETRYRYCLWHIIKKLPEKLGSHSMCNCGLKSSILGCVYNSQTCIQFKESWGRLLEAYQLHDNVWLSGLYEERTFWVPVYLKDIFWVGMNTTQRSKSMNSFFDGFVHSGTTLKEFVDQFDNGLRKKIENEQSADFNSFNAIIPCVSICKIEKQFQSVYTNEKFMEVQREIMGMICCNCSLIKNEGAISTYEVSDTVQIENFTKDVKVCVYFNIDEFELKCTCALFETRRILCRHAFSVFSAQCGDISLPSNYILDRCRKDLMRNYTLIKSSYDDLCVNPDTQRHDHLMGLFSKVAKLISRNEERYSNMVDYLVDVKDQCGDLMCEPRPSKQIVPTNRSVEKGKKVLSSNAVRGKGRPPTRRKLSTVEKSIKHKKKNSMKQKV